VVLGVIAILTSLLLPSVTRAKEQTRSTFCMNHLKQLQLAYLSYSHDNADAVVPSISRNIDLIQQSVPPSWVVGNAKHDRSTSNLEAGLLYPELCNAQVYRCPADNAPGPIPGTRRFRSYSLSGWAAATDVEGKGERFAGNIKLNQINSRPLTEILAFTDEHPDSIDDGVFAVYARVARMEWKDLPADRHRRGCNFSFLDGHVEHWTWKAPKVFRDYDQRPANRLDEEDLVWVKDHLTDPPPTR
jgi:prepilin-type processing-associated H-X9-DG protein